MGFGDTKFQSPSPTAVHTPVATRKSNGAGAGKWLNGVEGSSPLLPVQLAQHYQAAMASDSSSSPSPQQSRRQAERAREGKQGHGHILRTGAMGVITDDIHEDNDLILRQAALGSQEAQAMIDRSPSREWPEDFEMRKDGPWQREEDGVVAEHLRQDPPQLIGPLGKEQLSLSEEAALDGFEALSEDDGRGGVDSPPATSRVVGPAPSAHRRTMKQGLRAQVIRRRGSMRWTSPTTLQWARFQVTVLMKTWSRVVDHRECGRRHASEVTPAKRGAGILQATCGARPTCQGQWS